MDLKANLELLWTLASITVNAITNNHRYHLIHNCIHHYHQDVYYFPSNHTTHVFNSPRVWIATVILANLHFFKSKILENGQKNEAVDQSSNSDIPSDGTMEIVENMKMYEFIFVNYTQPFLAS